MTKNLQHTTEDTRMSNSNAQISVAPDTDCFPWPLFPLPRTYVVFAIDPIATLASLNDAEAITAASILPSRQYVGYVADVQASATRILIPVDTLSNWVQYGLDVKT